ncbi:MAG: hypothetical protein ABI557_02885 [Aureliella sp.]
MSKTDSKTIRYGSKLVTDNPAADQKIGAEVNLRTQLHRVLKSAGIVPWPKAFVNLRASCRTDLQEHFPDHVINT